MPRVATAPLRALTPTTSKGFAVIAFATLLGVPFMPWQEEAVIRALELNVDGTYRFKKILILVGRQSGKTHLLKVLALWRMIEDGAKLVLGSAQALDISKEAWQGSVDLLEDSTLVGLIAPRGVRVANGDQQLKLTGGARYRICATTRGAGRGLSVDLLIMDEIREQRDWQAWAALSKTVIARPGSQIMLISNAGDDESVVLNSLREAALSEKDDTMCLLEWSAPEGCAIDDPAMWAYGLPALGHTIDEATVRSSLQTDPANIFRTEILCQHVSSLDNALDPIGWAAGADPSGSMAPYRDCLAAGLDVSLDGTHVSLVVAAVRDDGQYRAEPVASWSSTGDCRTELPEILAKLKPTGLAWFPNGPANALAPFLRSLNYSVEITGTDATAACMGLTDLIKAGRVQHNAGALLDGQVATVAKSGQGDQFRFTRRGGGSCSAVYAMAGAVHLARVAEAKPKRAKAFVM